MTDSENLKRVIKVCMFDQYGTVVDMQGGLTKVVVRRWPVSPTSTRSPRSPSS